MSEKYYVLFGSEDGEPSIREMTREEVLQMFTPDEDGEYEYGKREALDHLPEDLDLQGNFWGYQALIIKGEIVTPKPKQVVTEYDLP